MEPIALTHELEQISPVAEHKAEGEFEAIASGSFSEEKAISGMPTSPGKGLGDSNISEADFHCQALLPRGTIVKISGNARTKASLIGLKATVRRSAALGGWHWLQLPTGEEIKLQRNALTALEIPVGVEPESSASEGDRHKPVTPLSYRNPALRELQQTHALDASMRLPMKRPASTPAGGIDYDGRRTSLRQQAAAYPDPHVNLGKLKTPTLRRYLAAYSLDSDGASREELLDTAERHFGAQQVSEEDVVRRFLIAAKRHTTGTPSTGAAVPT